MSATAVFVKMHTADPGAGGAANAAANATRKALSVADELDASGRLAQDAVIAYTGGEVTTTESYAWISYWTLVAGGVWLGNEDIANQAATAASPLNIAAGVITITDPNTQDFILRTSVFAWVNTNSFRRLRNWMGAHRAVLAKAQKTKFNLQRPQQI